jgi:hypothetical protein
VAIEEVVASEVDKYGMNKNVKWVKLPPFNCDTQHPDRWKDYVQFLSCCYLFFPQTHAINVPLLYLDVSS